MANETILLTAAPGDVQQAAEHLLPGELPTEAEIPADVRPDDGGELLVAVQGRDRDGRRASVSRWARLRRVGEAFVNAPPTPLWPRGADWRLHVRGDCTDATLVLPRSAACMDVERIELERTVEGGGSDTPWEEERRLDAAAFTATFDLLEGSQRVRWVIVTSGGHERRTSWSQAVERTDMTWSMPSVTFGGRTS